MDSLESSVIFTGTFPETGWSLFSENGLACWVWSTVLFFSEPLTTPDDYSPGYHVILVDDAVVTVRWDQVKGV